MKNETFSQTVKRLNFTMIGINGGAFKMGIPNSSIMGGSNERPLHNCRIPDFYLAETVVTNALWDAVMETKTAAPKMPAIRKTIAEIETFIVKLNEITGKSYRLPSEAEWEYAAGGGASDRTIYAGTSKTLKLAEYAVYEADNMHPVKTKLPNALGLYDMSGNVWEYCADDWHWDYLGAPNDGSAWVDTPRGEAGVIRGGAHDFNADAVRVSYRDPVILACRAIAVGIRLALTTN